MADRFQFEPDDYLGLKYEEYKNDMYALAISFPREYFKLRKNVLKSVKTQAIGDIYTTFYNVLSQGTDKEGVNIINPRGETDLSPGYPKQEVSKIALKAARTLDSILDEVIGIILPLNYKHLATIRSEQKAIGQVIK